jgi:predicted phosphodiesterase
VRIGLASDTQGNVEGLARALDLFERAAVDQVLFLGGRYADADAALARRRAGPPPAAGKGDAAFLDAARGAHARQSDPLFGRIVRVASRACPEYALDPGARMHVDMLEGRICCAVHDKASLGRDDIENASVLFHGHSAHAAIVQFGPRCFVTPGHLRADAPSGAPASFSLVDLDDRELVMKVFSADATELRTERAVFGAGAKISVR